MSHLGAGLSKKSQCHCQRIWTNSQASLSCFFLLSFLFSSSIVASLLVFVDSAKLFNPKNLLAKYTSYTQCLYTHSNKVKDWTFPVSFYLMMFIGCNTQITYPFKKSQTISRKFGVQRKISLDTRRETSIQLVLFVRILETRDALFFSGESKIVGISVVGPINRVQLRICWWWTRQTTSLRRDIGYTASISYSACF